VRTRTLLFAAALAVLAAGCGSSSTLSARALAKQADSVQSLAAEGAMLAQDAAAGRSTGPYTRVHAADLHKVAAKEQATLGQAKTAAQSVEPKLHQLTRLAARVAADLEKLGHASRAEQRALARDLDAAAGQAKKISESLG
jgi:hypothetical protein